MSTKYIFESLLSEKKQRNKKEIMNKMLKRRVKEFILIPHIHMHLECVYSIHTELLSHVQTDENKNKKESNTAKKNTLFEKETKKSIWFSFKKFPFPISFVAKDQEAEFLCFILHEIGIVPETISFAHTQRAG